MIIPHDQLQPETLIALIEEFVTRHGAVHGHRDASADEMGSEVLRHLRSGKAAIVFDERDESCTIVMQEQLPRDGRAQTPDMREMRAEDS